LLPAFIEWSPGPHPSTAQQNLGVQLESVQLTHPAPNTLRDALKALQVDHLATINKGEPALSFVLRTPTGSVMLD